MKKNIFKIITIILFVLILINIFIIISKNLNNTYLILDYDDILKINDNSFKNVSMNRIKHLNYSKAYVFDEQEKEEGFISIKENGEEVSFYDENMNISSNNIILVGNSDIVDRIIKGTNKLTEEDINFINNALDEQSIEFDIVENNIIITKYSVNNNDAVYSILYYGDEIHSIILYKNGNKKDIIYNKKTKSDNYELLNNVIFFKNNSKPIILTSVVPPYAGYVICVNAYSDSTGNYKRITNCEEE